MNKKKKALFQKLNYKPHEKQIEIHSSVDIYTYTTVLSGRQAGKTTASIHELVYQALTLPSNSILYIVTPNLAHAYKIRDSLLNIFRTKLSAFLVKHNAHENTFVLTNGNLIRYKSAENVQALAGETVSFCIIDESGYITNEALNVLLPAVLAGAGKLLAIGTPDQSGTWFQEFFNAGLDEANSEYNSVHMTSFDNSYLSEKALSLMTEHFNNASDFIKNRFYLGEFAESTDTLFSSALVNELAVLPAKQPYLPYKKYVAGVDLAIARDFTVVTVFDVSKEPFELVNIDRFRINTWTGTILRISEMLKEYNYPITYIDATGAGSSVSEELSRHIKNIVPFHFDRLSKQTLIENLIFALETKKVKLINSHDIKTELLAFSAKRTRAGNITYEARGSLNDDIVISIALALLAAKERYSVNIPSFSSFISQQSFITNTF